MLESGLVCLAEGVHAERGFGFELEDGDEPAHHAEAADGKQEFDDLAGREVLAQAGERLAGGVRRVEVKPAGSRADADRAAPAGPRRMFGDVYLGGLPCGGRKGGIGSRANIRGPDHRAGTASTASATA